MLLVESGGVDEHHLHEAGGGISELLQPQHFGEPGNGRKRSFEEAALGRRPGLVCLVEESPPEVHAAQCVLVFDRHLI